MEYGKPQKLPDGRYFLKINGSQRQVNGLVLQDDLSTKSVNFKVPEGSEIFSATRPGPTSASLRYTGKRPVLFNPHPTRRLGATGNPHRT